MTTEPPKRRRWLQFRLRTLLIAVLVLSLPLSWFAVRMEKARRQREAVEALQSTGIFLEWQIVRESEPGVPTWLAKLFGDNYLFVEVRQVIWNGQSNWKPVRDEHMIHLADLPDLWRIAVPTCRVSDVGVEHLKGLTSLRSLDLSHTEVTDDGLKHLKEMSELRHLFLNGTQITDGGLEYLKGLANLEWLSLKGTQVTAQGVKKLQKAFPNCKIEWGDYGQVWFEQDTGTSQRLSR